MLTNFVCNELTRPSTIQKIPRLLWNPQVCYHVKNSPTLSWNKLIQSTHTPTPYSSKIQINIMLKSTPNFSKTSFTLKFVHQYSVRVSDLSRVCYMSRPSHTNSVWRTVHVMQLSLLTVVICQCQTVPSRACRRPTPRSPEQSASGTGGGCQGPCMWSRGT
jgi:hypothetical protein